MSYVYRFIGHKNDILYVGKTVSLESRLETHIRYGHVKFDTHFINEVKRIEYAKTETVLDMDILEIILINEWKPEYNRVSTGRGKTTFIYEIPEFQEYTDYDYTKYQSTSDYINVCNYLERLSYERWDISDKESIYFRKVHRKWTKDIPVYFNGEYKEIHLTKNENTKRTLVFKDDELIGLKSFEVFSLLDYYR